MAGVQESGAPAPARKDRRSGRAAGGFAIASAITGFGAVAVALAMSPWFNWTTDALSDLGHPRYPSAAVFGAGLFAAGLFYVDAVLHASLFLGSSRLAKSAVFFLVAGGLSLSAIGLINESYGKPHFVVSFTYFTFVPLGMFLLALCIRRVRPRFAYLTMATAAAAALFGISIIAAIVYGAPFPSQAIPELIASAILAAWAVVAGAALLRGKFPAAA